MANCILKLLSFRTCPACPRDWALSQKLSQYLVIHFSQWSCEAGCLNLLSERGTARLSSETHIVEMASNGTEVSAAAMWIQSPQMTLLLLHCMQVLESKVKSQFWFLFSFLTRSHSLQLDSIQSKTVYFISSEEILS